MSQGATPRPEDLQALFAAAMAGLEPFPSQPRLAAGVSGGADSLALAVLADAWVRARSGSLLALIVDHGLRPEAAEEATRTATVMHSRGIAARILTIPPLYRGPGLAERARAARFTALTAACAEAGITDLLLGQHAADQAETVLIRALSSSSTDGLAGIPALREFAAGRVLRPLLAIPPASLRDFLRAAGIGWVEDPSNTNLAALRARLRQLRADRAGGGPATRALSAAAHAAGLARARTEAMTADWLAAHVSLRPEGFALLPHGPFPASVLSALIRGIAGAPYPPPMDGVATLAARPRAATLAGTRLLPAGTLGPGWLLIREAAAMAAPIPAIQGAIWDHRFRLAQAPRDGLTLGALGADSRHLRDRSPLPAAVLATLPALRDGATLFAVPHLRYPDAARCADLSIVPATPHPAAIPPFIGIAPHMWG